MIEGVYMSKPLLKGISRRDFFRATAAAGSLAVPHLASGGLFGAQAPSSRLRVGQIGCGRIARGHDMPDTLKCGMADIVALCDVDSKRLSEGRQWVEDWYRKAAMKPPELSLFGDYRELLARPDIDAVIISTPDHWHAEPAVAAAQAGKDIYLQKPMAMTIAESKLVRDVVQKTGRILQVGSQQRSWEQFRRACELVRSGRVGRLTRVEIGLPTDPTAPDDPEQPVPPNLNYDRWLGSTPVVYYTQQRVHPQEGYDRPGWLRNESYCLGMITGWGSHHYDTAHWGMDMELSGPIKVEAKAEFPPNKIWNVHGAYEIELTYPRDIRVHVSNRFPNGVKFIGDEGWIFVSRGDVAVTSSDPAVPGVALKALDASDPKLLDPAGVKVQLYRSDDQHKNWLECVRSRKAPIAPAAVGHSALAACFVSWVAMKLGRPLTWDPEIEQFVGDQQANAMLSRPERAPYGVTRVVKA
jgi:myo-inositol 2-dehydrogenase/D-chiro-inositol 1-dehydrogenase